MLSLPSILRFLLALLGLGLILIIGLFWIMGGFRAMTAFTLPDTDGPYEPSMRKLRNLYGEGSGKDDAVAEFIAKHTGVYTKPTIALLQRSDPESNGEELALFFADFYSDNCRVRTALLNRVLANDSHSSRMATISLMHRPWDEVNVPSDADSIVSTTSIRFHDDPDIEQPPDAWLRFGSMQSQELFEEHKDHASGIRLSASELSSTERLELMYWLEAVIESRPSNELVSKALANLGSDYYVVSAQANQGQLSDYLPKLKEWIVEVELEYVVAECGTT